ncbi:MAG: hypothetical protein KKD25_06650 [Gammaproteobacteria bacterium]|nr:hypothetical protein [Gammaproteobacteria bacterium]MBU0772273.1 hypothetical protein [Gammaproteobacteria bacterium]MBU0857884.1 hypothetical protein [Gammaproteobacteria bacterium]MBU1848400.1 hypothetical protein [Gammaproteobacteria bacterium]
MSPSHPAQLGALAGSMSRSVRGAASTFTQIVSERVGMSVSHVELVTHAHVERCCDQLGDPQDDHPDARLCSVVQRMRTADGAHAEATLVLPESGGLALVRRMLGLPHDIGELTELEQDALAEIGNIVIDACTGVLSGAFGWHVEAAQPHVSLNARERRSGARNRSGSALVTHLSMHLSGQRTKGLVVLEMDSAAMAPDAFAQRLHA